MSIGDVDRALGSADAEERRRAAADLVGISPPDPRLLLRALGDADWRVRKEAVHSAVALAPSSEVLDALLDALGPSDNVGLHNAAVEALAGFGIHAIAPLALAGQRLDADGRKLVVDALARAARPEALPVLQSLLRDPDVNVRMAAVEAIAAVGDACAEDAIALLDGCLDSADTLERLAALDGLNRLAAVLPWERIEPLSGDPALVPAAVVAAGRSAAREAVPFIVRQLEEGRGRLWSDALEALGRASLSSPLVRADAEEAVRKSSSALKQRVLDVIRREDEPAARRRTALSVASLIGGKDVAALAVEALADDDIAADAEAVLLELGSNAVDALVEGTHSPSARRRARAAELLGPLVSLDPDARSATWSLLSDPSAEVVAAALGALGEAGDAEALSAAAQRVVPSSPSLIHQAAHRALLLLARRFPDRAKDLARRVEPSSPEAEAAVAVIEALGSQVRGDEAADLAFLAACATSEHASVRRSALAALSTLRDEEVLRPISLALTDEEAEVRLAAVRALGRLRSESGQALGFEALAALVRRGDDVELKAAAARALGELSDGRATPVLREALGTEPRVAVAALEALATRSPDELGELLEFVFSHPAPDVVKVALRALAARGDASAVRRIVPVLEHESRDVRRLAAEVLGRLGANDALAALRGRLMVEVEPAVKEAVALAILELESGSGRRMTAPPPSLGGGRRGR